MYLKTTASTKFPACPMSLLPSNDLALEWSRDSSLVSPLYWGLGSFQSGTPCAGAFSHPEPQLTFLPSSHSKAGGFGCQISVFSQEGMFCGGDLPVSGLGCPRVSGLASSKEPAHCCLLWKLFFLASLSAMLCRTLLLVGNLLVSPKSWAGKPRKGVDQDCCFQGRCYIFQLGDQSLTSTRLYSAL